MNGKGIEVENDSDRERVTVILTVGVYTLLELSPDRR